MRTGRKTKHYESYHFICLLQILKYEQLVRKFFSYFRRKTKSRHFYLPPVAI